MSPSLFLLQILNPVATVLSPLSDALIGKASRCGRTKVRRNTNSGSNRHRCIDVDCDPNRNRNQDLLATGAATAAVAGFASAGLAAAFGCTFQKLPANFCQSPRISLARALSVASRCL